MKQRSPTSLSTKCRGHINRTCSKYVGANVMKLNTKLIRISTAGKRTMQLDSISTEASKTITIITH